MSDDKDLDLEPGIDEAPDTEPSSDGLELYEDLDTPDLSLGEDDEPEVEEFTETYITSSGGETDPSESDYDTFEMDPDEESEEEDESDPDEEEIDEEDLDEEEDEELEEENKLPLKLIAAAIAGVIVIGGSATMMMSKSPAPAYPAPAPMPSTLQDIIPEAPQSAVSELTSVNDTSSAVQIPGLESIDIPPAATAEPVMPTPAASVAPAVTEVFDGGSDLPVHEVSHSQSFTLDDVRKVIAEELQAHAKVERQWMTGMFAKSQEAISSKVDTLNIAGIEKKLADIGIAVSKTTKAVESIDISYQPTASKRISAKELEALKDGRSRLKGFQQLSTTENSEYSIVRTPSGRISTFFKGEKFYVGGKTMRVASIEDGGRLILIGKSHYIDNVFEAAPKKKAPAAKKAEQAPVKADTADAKQVSAPSEVKVAAPEPAKVVATKEEKAPVSEKMKESVESVNYILSYVGTPDALEQNSVEENWKANGKSDAKVQTFKAPNSKLQGHDIPTDGWSFHGAFDGGYLLNNPAGDWVIVKVGEHVEGLGRVSGLDRDRQLLIGKYLISTSR